MARYRDTSKVVRSLWMIGIGRTLFFPPPLGGLIGQDQP